MVNAIAAATVIVGLLLANASITRLIAGCSRFFTFTQCFDFVVVLAGMQRVEIGNAIEAQDHSLAVDHKLKDAVSQSGLTDPREAARPVIAAARDHFTRSRSRSSRGDTHRT
jgi:hypothetical protein